MTADKNLRRSSMALASQRRETRPGALDFQCSTGRRSTTPVDSARSAEKPGVEIWVGGLQARTEIERAQHVFQGVAHRVVLISSTRSKWRPDRVDHAGIDVRLHRGTGVSLGEGT